MFGVIIYILDENHAHSTPWGSSENREGIWFGFCPLSKMRLLFVSFSRMSGRERIKWENDEAVLLRSSRSDGVPIGKSLWLEIIDHDFNTCFASSSQIEGFKHPTLCAAFKCSCVIMEAITSCHFPNANWLFNKFLPNSFSAEGIKQYPYLVLKCSAALCSGNWMRVWWCVILFQLAYLLECKPSCWLCWHSIFLKINKECSALSMPASY